MIPLAGTSSGTAIRRRYISIASGSTNSVLSPDEDGLHSFLRRMMRPITTRSF